MEIPTDGNRREQNLSGAIFGRGYAGDLSQKIDPASNPTDRRNPCFGRQSGDGIVESATRRIGRNQFRDRARDAHTAGTRNQPAPDCGSGTTGLQRVDKCGGGGCEQAGNANGEREGREIAELTLEDLRCVSTFLAAYGPRCPVQACIRIVRQGLYQQRSAPPDSRFSVFPTHLGFPQCQHYACGGRYR